ncbi:hypothetical protein [Hymenobacter saemangeumensis]|uniref:hypothetical protein n=1 Tax=Hymenobacter saemangeumensis TaxID=1084522 RepID=UPI0031E6D4B3
MNKPEAACLSALFVKYLRVVALLPDSVKVKKGFNFLVTNDNFLFTKAAWPMVE